MLSAILPSGAALIAPPLALAVLNGTVFRHLARRQHPASLESMSGESWEDLCATLFRRHGFHVQRTPRTGDFGADLILSRGQRRIAVECKRWATKPVGPDVIRGLRGGMEFYRCNEGMVVSALTGYTRRARFCAARIGIELYTLDRLAGEFREPDLLALRQRPRRSCHWPRRR